jgi:hypothetical protein
VISQGNQPRRERLPLRSLGGRDIARVPALFTGISVVDLMADKSRDGRGDKGKVRCRMVRGGIEWADQLEMRIAEVK